jgi:hypothetical protein
MFHCHQHCTAPFTSGGEPLNKSKSREQNWSREADRFIGWEQAYASSGGANDDERYDQRFPPSYPVT